MENILLCPICNKNNNLKHWTSLDYNGISSKECIECDIVFAEKMLDDGEYIKFYNKYNNSRDTEKEDLAIKRNICYQNDIKFINKTCGNMFKNILDIGCGNGKFLSLFNSEKKTGYDIDINIIIENKSKYTDINFISDLNKININEKFDLIIFRGTFQYIRDIKKMKDFINNKLNINGYLIILALANKNSPLAEIQRENWGLYNPIEMFNIFSLTSIKSIFNDYNTINIDFPYLDTPYASEKYDIQKFKDLIVDNKQSKFPFWGSIMQVIFQKRDI